MSVSAFDHPVLSGLLGDAEAAAFFTFEADLEAMLRFEAALARAEAAEGVIPAPAAEAVVRACHRFSPDVKALRAATARDGVVVPELVRQLRAAVGEEHGDAVHAGATSQDVVDTSLTLRLKGFAVLVEARLDTVIGKLDDLTGRHGGNGLPGRTRMRRAIGMTVADRLRSWRDPLARQRPLFAETARRACLVQFGGAVGTLDGVDGKGPAVARRLGAELGLDVPEASWHAERDRLVALADALARLSGTLGKIGQDVVLMVQDELAEIELAGGGGSSAMPHKQNPVAAEVLVTLARYASSQLPALHGAMVHEQERSGAAWTLEWMALPPLCVATASGLATAARLLDSIKRIGTPAT